MTLVRLSRPLHGHVARSTTHSGSRPCRCLSARHPSVWRGRGWVGDWATHDSPRRNGHLTTSPSTRLRRTPPLSPRLWLLTYLPPPPLRPAPLRWTSLPLSALRGRVTAQYTSLPAQVPHSTGRLGHLSWLRMKLLESLALLARWELLAFSEALRLTETPLRQRSRQDPETLLRGLSASLPSFSHGQSRCCRCMSNRGCSQEKGRVSSTAA